MELKVFIQPRASRNRIVGWHNCELKMAVTSPPVDGAANAHVIALLAQSLQLPKTNLVLISGQTKRHKRIAIDGLSELDFIRWQASFAQGQ